jgi:anti-sigma28 factor (negative regulator of flagellin synthesis)
MRVDDTGSHSLDVPAATLRTERTPPSGTTLPTSAAVVAPHADEVSAAEDRGRSAHASHIANIRAQLSGGTYKVDKEALASRMADDELARSGQ